MINAMSEMSPNGVITLALDDETDIENLSAYAEVNHLRLGSSAIVVDTGEVLQMKSDYSWVPRK